MAASLFESAIFRDLALDREVAALFTDSAEVRAMMIVEGVLAKVQGELGVIPELSAKAIHRASLELQIDPAGLAASTAKNAVPIPGLVAHFRELMQAPEHAQWIHYGATSQDIMDTALALRLRQAIALYETRLVSILTKLGQLAEEHAETPMVGRTYGQAATPTSFGCLVASWGRPLISLHEQLQALKPHVLRVSLGGAAGTLSAMGPKGEDVRAALAAGLGLGDPGASWHAERNGVAELAAWMTQVTVQLAKMGDDLTLLTQTGIGEVILAGAGGSSTMPQKQNPVIPSLLVALSRGMVGLNATMQFAPVHRLQRDGAAWISEWMTLPQMCLTAGRALSAADDLAASISPNADAMLAGIDDGTGLIFAEALSFKLIEVMPRPDAQAKVKELCQSVIKDGGSLRQLAQEAWPDLNLADCFNPRQILGTAAKDARSFKVSTTLLAN